MKLVVRAAVSTRHRQDQASGQPIACCARDGTGSHPGSQTGPTPEETAVPCQPGVSVLAVLLQAIARQRGRANIATIAATTAATMKMTPRPLLWSVIIRMPMTSATTATRPAMAM